jgi:hypothetical protein
MSPRTLRSSRGDDGSPRAAVARQGGPNAEAWWRMPTTMWRARARRARRESTDRRYEKPKTSASGYV